MTRSTLLAGLALAAMGPMPRSMPRGGTQSFRRSNVGLGGKYVGAAPSAREAARIEWRENVNRAAREWQDDPCNRTWTMPSVLLRFYRIPRCRRFLPAINYERARRRAEFDDRPAVDALDAALSAPRPWRSPRKPTPRRRYSRAHRKGCRWCRITQRAIRRGHSRAWTWNFVPHALGVAEVKMIEVRVENPHGSSA